MSPSYPTTHVPGPGYQDPIHRILQQPFRPSGPAGPGGRESLPKYLRNRPIGKTANPYKPPLRVPKVPWTPTVPRAFIPALLRAVPDPRLRAGLLLFSLLYEFDHWSVDDANTNPGVIANGWIKRWDCEPWVPSPSSGILWLHQNTLPAANACIGGQGWGLSGSGYDDEFSTVTWTGLSLANCHNVTGDCSHWKEAARYRRNPDWAAGPKLAPQHGNRSNAPIIPRTWDKPVNPYDPSTYPLGGSNPWRPSPVPYVLIPTRDKHPHPETVRENGDPDTRPNERPEPWTRGEGVKDPWKHPLPTLTVPIRGPIDHTPGVHIKEPPGPKVKERKRAVSRGLLGVLTDFLGVITEVSDVVWALYLALPWKVRAFKGKDGKWHPKDATIQARIERIYDNMHLIDTGKFIENLITNQLEDAIIGRIGRISKESVQKLVKDGLYHSPIGWGTGPVH